MDITLWNMEAVLSGHNKDVVQALTHAINWVLNHEYDNAKAALVLAQDALNKAELQNEACVDYLGG